MLNVMSLGVFGILLVPPQIEMHFVNEQFTQKSCQGMDQVYIRPFQIIIVFISFLPTMYFDAVPRLLWGRGLFWIREMESKMGESEMGDNG